MQHTDLYFETIRKRMLMTLVFCPNQGGKQFVQTLLFSLHALLWSGKSPSIGACGTTLPRLKRFLGFGQSRFDFSHHVPICEMIIPEFPARGSFHIHQVRQDHSWRKRANPMLVLDANTLCTVTSLNKPKASIWEIPNLLSVSGLVSE